MSDDEFHWTDAELAKPPTLAEARSGYHRWVKFSRSHVGRYVCHGEYRTRRLAMRYRRPGDAIFRIEIVPDKPRKKRAKP